VSAGPPMDATWKPESRIARAPGRSFSGTSLGTRDWRDGLSNAPAADVHAVRR